MTDASARGILLILVLTKLIVFLAHTLVIIVKKYLNQFKLVHVHAQMRKVQNYQSSNLNLFQRLMPQQEGFC
jgi:hypothetical protein